MCFFFFNDTATTEIYTLSLHDALPIWDRLELFRLADEQQTTGHLVVVQRFGADVVTRRPHASSVGNDGGEHAAQPDRKSTRLNSSHSQISYAVFCLKKKKPHIRACVHL